MGTGAGGIEGSGGVLETPVLDAEEDARKFNVEEVDTSTDNVSEVATVVDVSVELTDCGDVEVDTALDVVDVTTIGVNEVVDVLGEGCIESADEDDVK